jgi:hypothetical protein
MNTKAPAEADRVASPRPHLGKSAQMILAVVAGIAFIGNPGLSQNLPTDALEIVVKGLIDPTDAEYMAELENLRSHNKYRSTEFRQDGTFRFGMIPNGDYRLIVFDGKSGILLDQIVTVTPLDDGGTEKWGHYGREKGTSDMVTLWPSLGVYEPALDAD